MPLTKAKNEFWDAAEVFSKSSANIHTRLVEVAAPLLNVNADLLPIEIRDKFQLVQSRLMGDISQITAVEAENIANWRLIRGKLFNTLFSVSCFP